jgi:predicted DNA-binding protein (MmcQ/YjbR family)
LCVLPFPGAIGLRQDSNNMPAFLFGGQTQNLRILGARDNTLHDVAIGHLCVLDADSQHVSTYVMPETCFPRQCLRKRVTMRYVNPKRAAQRIRTLALSFPRAYEDEPWGHPVFKVANNKMFASMSVDTDVVRLSVKVTPEERELALQMPFVEIAPYVGRYGWIMALVSDDESLEHALEWLRESYWLNAPAKLKKAVED